MAHPGLEAWARLRAARLGEGGEGCAGRGGPYRQGLDPPRKACVLRGCEEAAVEDKEQLCAVHLRNLESWTKREVSPKVDMSPNGDTRATL